MLSTLARRAVRRAASRTSTAWIAPSHCAAALHRCFSVAPATAAAAAASPSKPLHQPSTSRPTDDHCVSDSAVAAAHAAKHAAGIATASSSSAAAAHAGPLPAPGSALHFDLVVLGSGPSGQKCAIDAAKKGKRVLVVDRAGMFGGVCIHTGTIPSKTFREAILHVTAHNQRGFGGEVAVRSPTLSSDVLDRVKKVEAWETQTILRQLHRNKVMTVCGSASFVDANHVLVTSNTPTSIGTAGQAAAADEHPNAGHTKLGSLASSSPNSDSNLSQSHIVRGDKILIACGSKPARNPNYPWDSPIVFDSDAILKNPTWGEINHLVVVGAGVIAMEYASMFNTLPNCKVTIIDERPSFLDFIDHEVIDALKYVMRRKGATFLLGEKVKNVSVQNSGKQVRVELDSGKDIVGDALFYAVGRQAESDPLGLQNAGVEIARRGLIPVNEFFQTSQPHIYAAGDIIGFPALASTAMEQGRLCSQHMFGTARPMKPVFPYGIYTIPEISVVGHSEQELTRLKIPYKSGKALYEETAKGQMMGGPHIDGFLKILFCPTTHRLLGVSAIGENATEIIHIGQSVMSLNGTLEYFRDSVFNFPTYAELYRIAALDALNKVEQSQPTSSQSNSDSNSGTPTV